MKPEFVRVKLAESGHEVTVAKHRLDESMTVLEKPAVNSFGRPLAPKAKRTVEQAAAVTNPYKGKRKAELLDEISARNVSRSEADQIQVDQSTRVPDLVAALEADDANQTSADSAAEGNTGGVAADIES